MANLSSENKIMETWNKDLPKVSISYIAYNHENYVDDAITSFLKQKTDFPFEILIHDDASTDDTQKRIKYYEEKYPKIIKPIYQKQNQYHKNTRMHYKFNHLRATGKYVAMCDGDDYWIDEYKLQKQYDYMEKNPDCSFVFHSAKIYDDANKKFDGEICYSAFDKLISNEHLFYGAGRTNPSSSIFYRKEFLDNPPNWFFKAPFGDTPTALILQTKGYIYFMAKHMSVYRVNVSVSWNNTIQNNKIKAIASQKKMIIILQEFNNYTNFRYDSDINKYCAKIKFQILKLQKDFNKMDIFKNYILRNYFRTLPIKKKIFFLLQHLTPAGYNLLKKSKRKFIS